MCEYQPKQVSYGKIDKIPGDHFRMLVHVFNFCNNLGCRIKQWAKPTTATLVAASLVDMTRSKTDLIAENAMLRQQLIVLNRQIKRPQLTNGDRLRLVLLARCTQFWQQALHIVQPDTLLRWHRELFRLYWRYKSRKKNREPRISQEVINLIKQMAQENRLWGAERIRGELLKLGIAVSKRTIQKYLDKLRPSPTGSQTWGTFLKNHAQHIWACDFTVVHDLLFRPVFIFVIIELHTRRILHTAVTYAPTDEWVTQQLREATPWGKRPKYLIRDRDKKYGPLFSSLLKATGIKAIKTPKRPPRANAVCERFIGSLKRECLDYMLILHCLQLHRLVREYVAYYNQARPHQGIEQQIPDWYGQEYPLATGPIIPTPVLNGLHHDYSRVAYLH
jgi:putative transposase